MEKNISGQWLMMENILATFLFLCVTSSCGFGDYDPVDQLKRGLAVIHPPAVSAPRTAHVKNSYIVMFRTAPGSDRQKFANYRSEYKFHFNLLARGHMSDPRVADIYFLSTVDLAKPQIPLPSLAIGMPAALRLKWEAKNLDPIVGSMAKVDFVSRDAAIEALAEWEKSGKIWYAEPNWISQISSAKTSLQGESNGNELNVFGQFATNYAANSSWHWAKDINAVAGYKYISDQIVAGNRTEEEFLESAPVIAVMDSGVDYDNILLKGRMWKNSSEGDADCPGDLYGCDTTVRIRGQLGVGTSVHPFGTEGPGEPCPNGGDGTDEAANSAAGNCHHGSHVAGIIAGRSSVSETEADGFGVPGICPVCKIMVIKIVGATATSPGGTIVDASILNGLRYVTRFIRDGTNVVRIVNASIGKFQRSRSTALLVAQLKQNGLGTLIIGAAGNENTNTRSYPAALSPALAVSSVASDGGKASYSNYGSWVDISAPGGYALNPILSVNPGSTELHPSQGTSMATPVVAGVAGMLLAADGSLSASDLRSILIDNANPSIYEDETNANFYYQFVGEARIPMLGSGRVDLFSSLSRAGGALTFEDFLNERVAPGCGVVGGVGSFNFIGEGFAFDRGNRVVERNILMFIFLLLLPLLIVFWMNQSRGQTLVGRSPEGGG